MDYLSKNDWICLETGKRYIKQRHKIYSDDLGSWWIIMPTDLIQVHVGPFKEAMSAARYVDSGGVMSVIVPLESEDRRDGNGRIFLHRSNM